MKMNETQDNQNLKRLQEVDLTLLKLFVSICEKHNLRYYAIGGTLLGVVRHHGFIPWDDDIDVGMPRPDYEQFIRIAPSELEAPYRLRTLDVNEPYRTYMLRVEDTSVAMEREYYKKGGTEMRKLYAWIDILPLDGAPGDRDEFYRYLKILKRVRQLMAFSMIDKNMGTSKKRSKKEMKLLQFGLNTGIYRILKPELLYRLYRKICLRYPYDSSPLVGDTMAVYGKTASYRKEFVRRQVFGKPVFLPFEDMKLACPRDYDNYLRHLYGNYMQLPPESERETHEIHFLSE